MGETIRVLVFSWHERTDAYNGGLARTRGFLSRANQHSYTFVDRWRPIVEPTQNVQLAPYRVPRLFDLVTQRFYPVGRFIDWSWSMFAMIAVGIARSAHRRFDVVYIPASELPHMALAGFVVGKLTRTRIVFANLNTKAVPGWAVNRILHKHVDRIIALSRGLADEIRAEGINVPITINGVGVEDPPSNASDAGRDDLVVYVARHTEAKGVWDVLHIWELVRNEFGSAVLAMAGVVTPKVRAQIERFVKDRDMAASVQLLGPISDAKKWSLYSRAKCCLFPSHVEGWGIVPIEAMMLGVPVVAYDLPAYQDTIVGLPGVTLIEIGDHVSAARAVCEHLARVEADRAQLGALLVAAASRFRWDVVVQREEAVLRDVCSG